MENETHEIQSVEEYEQMLEAQKITARYNAIFCSIISGICVSDACLFLHTNNVGALIMAGISGILGAKHYLYLKDGQYLIKEYEEKIKELKK